MVFSRISNMTNIVKEYGILTLPILLMMMFGLFGHRPGQIRNKLISFLLNLLCCINYLIICTVVVCFLRDIIQFNRYSLVSYEVFGVLVAINYTLLLYILYKKHNLLGLMEDVKTLRRTSMQKLNLLHLWMMFFLIIITFASVIYILFADITGHGLRIHPPIDSTNSSFLSADGFLTLLEFMVYPVSAWASIIVPSFVLGVMASVIANEFNTCDSALEQSMVNANTFSLEELIKMTDQFHELATMVKRVDAMFSKTVALNLAAALGSLCVAVYTIAQGGNVTDWTLALACPALTLMILIPPLTSLNTKVYDIKFTHLTYPSPYYVKTKIPVTKCYP